MKCTCWNSWDLCDSCDAKLRHRERNTFERSFHMSVFGYHIIMGISIPLKRGIGWTGFMGTHFTLQDKNGQILVIW